MDYTVTTALLDFPRWAPAPKKIIVSDAELQWAAATMGVQRSAHVRNLSIRNVDQRLATLRNAFSFTTTGSTHTLSHSPSYLAMAPSDVAHMSYFLGGVAAKLTAAKIFAVPFLADLDTVLRGAGRSLNGTRPDYVGVGLPPLAARVVVEAKGTVGPFNATTLFEARKQAKSNRPKKPVRPRRLFWGQVAFFDPDWGIVMQDPEPDDFTFPSAEQLLRGYYSPLLSELSDGSSQVLDGATGDWRRFPTAFGELAISAEVYELAAEGNWQALANAHSIAELPDERDVFDGSPEAEIPAPTGHSLWGVPAPWADTPAEVHVALDGTAFRATRPIWS